MYGLYEVPTTSAVKENLQTEQGEVGTESRSKCVIVKIPEGLHCLSIIDLLRHEENLKNKENI
jgi:hypothetical protein